MSITDEADELLVATASELEGQRGLSREMGLADLAHTIVLVEAGVVPAEPGAELMGALLELHDRPGDLILDARRGDLYTNREAWLVERTASAAWLGAGRARREATTIAFLLAVRGAVLELSAALIRCGRALIHRAGELRDALAPDYTYLQAAQPTSFGHYLLTTVAGIGRDLERLAAFFGRVDRSPAGCGSANGSRLPQDRRRLAELLGFGAIVEHARDAMWQADLPIEGVSAAVAAAVNLDRLAEDLLFFSAAEVGFVELSGGHTRSSKIMPHKRNPYALAHVRAMANRLIGTQAALTASGRTPSGQIDNRVLAYGDLGAALRDAAGAAALMAAVVAGMRFRGDRAAECLARSFVSATDVAELLVLVAGLDFRTAHATVARLVVELAEQGRAPASLTPADVDRAAGRPLSLSTAALSRALDPVAAVRARRGLGSAAPEQVDELCGSLGAALDEHDGWRAGAARRISLAERALVERARAMAGAT